MRAIREAIRAVPPLAAAARAVRRAAYRIERRRLRARRGREVRAYLATAKVPRLHVGAGFHPLPGWLNADLNPKSPDVILLDAREPLPFDDAAFHYVFHEHLIEHLELDEGEAFTRECFRILRPGGRIRIATPALEVYLGLFRPALEPIQIRYLEWIHATCLPGRRGRLPSVALNLGLHHWGHRFVYDRPALRALLEGVGFRDVVERAVGESDDPYLRGIERHFEDIGDVEINRFETMVFEAARP